MAVALSTTKTKYIALSPALCDLMYVSMQLLNELISFGISIPMQVPTVRFEVFEDNVGAIELVRCPKLRPQTKHIAIQHHHFRTHVAKRLINIQHVTPPEQVADIATKISAS
jgi:hypothetical protein